MLDIARREMKQTLKEMISAKNKKILQEKGLMVTVEQSINKKLLEEARNQPFAADLCKL